MNTVAEAVELDAVAFKELESSFRGELVRPGHPSYDEHRKGWNGSIDGFPADATRR